MKARSQSGLTLVEILVVIAIIAVFIVLLNSALAKARPIARRSACLSNTRQIGLSWRQYALDQGSLPGTNGIQTSSEVFAMCKSYLPAGRMFNCPADRLASPGKEFTSIHNSYACVVNDPTGMPFTGTAADQPLIFDRGLPSTSIVIAATLPWAGSPHEADKVSRGGNIFCYGGNAIFRKHLHLGTGVTNGWILNP
jgi:prepilin-type N-terminal cleavage/methylation domain-containing protein